MHYKKNTSVLEILIFHDTRGVMPNKYVIVLSCVIYTIIDHCFCIDYLAFQSKKLNQISGDSKYVEKYLTEYWILEFQICWLTYFCAMVFQRTQNLLPY